MVMFNKSIGFVKWGFMLAIHCVYKGFSFEETMRFVLSYGGDTDTNCAIAGGLVSA